MQHFRVVYRGISHGSLTFSQNTYEPYVCLNANVYTKKIQVTSETFHGKPRESIAYLFYIMPLKIRIGNRMKANTVKALYYE